MIHTIQTSLPEIHSPVGRIAWKVSDKSQGHDSEAKVIRQVVSASSTGDVSIDITADNSSTPRAEIKQPSMDSVKAIFKLGNQFIFEDGVPTEFSRRLITFIQRYKDYAVVLIAAYSERDNANPENVGEALRWIGRMRQPDTHISRFWLLTRSLNHSHAYVRYGAILGLGSMDNPEAIPLVRRAIEAETVRELHADLQGLLSQLLATQQGE